MQPSRPAYVAGSAPGRVWMAAFSCVALAPALGYLAAAFALAIGLASFRREWRRSLLSVLAVCTIGLFPRTVAANRVSLGLALLYAAWIGGLLLWTHRPRGRRPLLWLHTIAIVALAAFCVSRSRSLLSGTAAAGLCALVPELLWRSAYWIKWRLRQRDHAAVWTNLFTALPFLGAGGVPFGKGPAFFAKHEAADAGQLASAQVEGVRLLALALGWRRPMRRSSGFCGASARAGYRPGRRFPRRRCPQWRR